MQHFIKEAHRLNLPLIAEDETPIFFIGVGKIELGFELCKRMLDLGYYLNIAAFPAVPYKNTGMRITLTYNLTEDDITEMLTVLSKQLDKLIDEFGTSRSAIYKAFKKKEPEFVYK